MMKNPHHKVILRKKEGGTYTVIVLPLPGCLTFGRTVEEVQAMAKEAIEGFVACLISRATRKCLLKIVVQWYAQLQLKQMPEI